MDFDILELMVRLHSPQVPKDFPKLLFSIGICLGAGIIGSFLQFPPFLLGMLL